MFAEIKLKMRREFGRVVWTVYVASVSCVLPAASQKERSVVVSDPEPVFFSNNFVTLLPGERTGIRAEDVPEGAEARLRGWNLKNATGTR